MLRIRRAATIRPAHPRSATSHSTPATLISTPNGTARRSRAVAYLGASGSARTIGTGAKKNPTSSTARVIDHFQRQILQIPHGSNTATASTKIPARLVAHIRSDPPEKKRYEGLK